MNLFLSSVIFLHAILLVLSYKETFELLLEVYLPTITEELASLSCHGDRLKRDVTSSILILILRQHSFFDSF